MHTDRARRGRKERVQWEATRAVRRGSLNALQREDVTRRNGVEKKEMRVKETCAQRQGSVSGLPCEDMLRPPCFLLYVQRLPQAL